jgi:hypothetical protein
MNNTITKNKDLENVVNRELFENYKIRESVSNCADNVSCTTALLGGGATFLGLASLAGYCAWNFLAGNSFPYDDSITGTYLPMAIISGGLSVPLGLVAGYATGAVGHALGTAYGVVKNSITRGPITTYRALRNKKQIEDAKILSVC